jgi:hypothetical protein
MKSFLLSAAFCIVSSTQDASAFSLNKSTLQSVATRVVNKIPQTNCVDAIQQQQPQQSSSIDEKNIMSRQQYTLTGAFTAASLSLLSFIDPVIVSAAVDVGDDMELTELPPVYVPILFAIGVLGGVGVLTASLGNVMDEGTLLFICIAISDCC